MRCLILLSLYARSFLAVLASDTSSVVWTSDKLLSVYSVFPQDPSKISEIEVTLENHFGAGDFEVFRQNQPFDSALQFNSTDHGLTDAIRAIEGVESVTRLEVPTPDYVGEETGRERRDDPEE